MLADALKYLFSQAMDTRRVGLRKIETPGAVPGTFLVANAGADGVYVVEEKHYELAPPRYLARTLAGFCDFMYNGLRASEGKDGWHVLIGDDAINGYLLEPLMGYHAAPNVSMKLTPTDQWLWVQEAQSMEPKELSRWIKKSWPSEDYTSNSIRKLLPLLSKISIQITNQKGQATSQNNESLGHDVTKSLTLADKAELPEVVSCQVKMYKEVDISVTVGMNCWFDFDEETVCLDPIENDLTSAEDLTNAGIDDLIAKGDPKPIISQVKLLNLHVGNEGVRIN